MLKGKSPGCQTCVTYLRTSEFNVLGRYKSHICIRYVNFLKYKTFCSKTPKYSLYNLFFYSKSRNEIVALVIRTYVLH